ncbi:MAG: hypothetical protein ACR2PO_15440 [Methyloligellaceae bacterium]
MSAQQQRTPPAGEIALGEEPSYGQEQDLPVSPESSSPLEGLITETINALAAGGVAMQDMGPLLHLKNAVQFISDADDSAALLSKRANAPASDTLLARTATIMDLLVQGGWSQEQAAQTMARQLIGSGVTLPESGGDSRGWKRLLHWRIRLREQLQSTDAQVEYERFTEELAEIPPEERLARALNDRLWDRRSVRTG